MSTPARPPADFRAAPRLVPADGTAVVVVSHNLQHVFHVADRIIKLDYGQLEFDQKAAEFFASAAPAAMLAGGAAPA